jgi:hypothetical protein
MLTAIITGLLSFALGFLAGRLRKPPPASRMRNLEDAHKAHFGGSLR